MIKTIIILIFMLLIGIYTIFDAIVCFFVSKIDAEAVRKHSARVVKFILKVVIMISGSRVYVAGLENMRALDNEKSFFAISNHRGFFDAISGYLLFEKNTGIIAKDSLKKVPIIHYWMKRIDCLFLNRKDLRDGVKMVIDAINNINNGITMWVFPEGTRNKNENPLDLLEFKQGTFKIPEKTNCYILPISFRNTEKAFENHWPSVKATDIYINIGVPYKISELSKDDQTNIATYSQEVMRNLLAEEKKWQML
ncbi:MAG: 1-acyl-sn-glycerol-3-phosphate acyltransferase [Lachnospiraceae bacterium]|nr:1-acyl-sn-glycerol-3-phosphate acyltransferase [Lachnospiraceae bacterium]